MLRKKLSTEALKDNLSKSSDREQRPLTFSGSHLILSPALLL
jgi:hypothetical protein